jgi:hypothetical protein
MFAGKFAALPFRNNYSHVMDMILPELPSRFSDALLQATDISHISNAVANKDRCLKSQFIRDHVRDGWQSSQY